MPDPAVAAPSSDRGPLSGGVLVAGLLVVSLLVKLALVAHLGDRAYGDVLRSVSFGLGVEQGVISIRSHVDNTKSFVGPLLGAAAHRFGGVAAIKGLNLALFAGLFATMAAIGRDREPEPVRVVALALFALYAGGHRNVAAGEIEDNLASLLFAVGLLAHLRRGQPYAPALWMGLGLVIKFWIALFVGGFGLFLVVRRRWRDAALVGLGALLPLLVLSLFDGGATLASLLLTAERQSGYSSWGTIGFRMLSTGLLPTVAIVAWAAWRWRRELDVLSLCLVGSYFAYVLVFRDAHAVTFVMPLCLVTASFPLASMLTVTPWLGGDPRRGRRRLVAILVVYAVAGAAIAWHNLIRDTHPYDVSPGRGAKPLAGAVAPQAALGSRSGA